MSKIYIHIYKYTLLGKDSPYIGHNHCPSLAKNKNKKDMDGSCTQYSTSFFLLQLCLLGLLFCRVENMWLYKSIQVSTYYIRVQDVYFKLLEVDKTHT